MDEEQERAAFAAWWRATMNTREMDLHPFIGGGFACHETNRSWMTWKARAALSQPTIEPVAWRCRSWGADEWAYFDGDDKPETVAPEQLEPLYASQPASDEAANIMELAHVYMVKPESPSNFDQVEARLKAYVNRVDRPAPEAMTFNDAVKLAKQAGMRSKGEGAWECHTGDIIAFARAVLYQRLTANGAEAWKDVPRTGDWVADAGDSDVK